MTMTSMNDIKGAIKEAAHNVAKKNGWTYRESAEMVKDLTLGMIEGTVEILTQPEVREGCCGPDCE